MIPIPTARRARPMTVWSSVLQIPSIPLLTMITIRDLTSNLQTEKLPLMIEVMLSALLPLSFLSSTTVLLWSTTKRPEPMITMSMVLHTRLTAMHSSLSRTLFCRIPLLQNWVKATWSTMPSTPDAPVTTLLRVRLSKLPGPSLPRMLSHITMMRRPVRRSRSIPVRPISLWSPAMVGAAL